MLKAIPPRTSPISWSSSGVFARLFPHRRLADGRQACELDEFIVFLLLMVVFALFSDWRMCLFFCGKKHSVFSILDKLLNLNYK